MARPTSKLPPESIMWGRSVESDLDSLRRDFNRLAQDTSNLNAQSAGTMAALSKQITRMNQVLRDLTNVVATIPTMGTAGDTNTNLYPWSASMGTNTGWLTANAPTITVTTISGRITILGTSSVAWSGYRSTCGLSYRLVNDETGAVIRTYGDRGIARVANVSETEEMQTVVMTDTFRLPPGTYTITLGCQGYAGAVNAAYGEFSHRTIIGWAF